MATSAVSTSKRNREDEQENGDTGRSALTHVLDIAQFQTENIADLSGPLQPAQKPVPRRWLESSLYYFDFDTLSIDTRKLVCRGAVSNIWKLQWYGSLVILKQWDEHFSEDSFRNEVEITRLCQCPRVVQLFGASLPHRAMILERLPRGNLREVVTSQGYSAGTAAPAKRIRQWALEIAQGMSFIHDQGVIHYDLKTLNVLVGQNWQTKICDFSHSCIASTFRRPPTWESTSSKKKSKIVPEVTSGQIGSFEYTAPEVFDRQEMTNKSDVYSFALLLWELFSYGEQPFMQYACDGAALRSHVMAPTHGRPPIKSSWPSTWRKLMRLCWDKAAFKRPAFRDIVQMIEECEDGGNI